MHPHAFHGAILLYSALFFFSDLELLHTLSTGAQPLLANHPHRAVLSLVHLSQGIDMYSCRLSPTEPLSSVRAGISGLALLKSPSYRWAIPFSPLIRTMPRVEDL